MATYGSTSYSDRGFRIAPLSFPAANDTVILDLNLGNAFRIQLPAGNITIGPTINQVIGDRLAIELVQDGIGLRHVTFDNSFLLHRATALTATAAAIDLFTFGFTAAGTWHQAAAVMDLVPGGTL